MEKNTAKLTRTNCFVLTRKVIFSMEPLLLVFNSFALELRSFRIEILIEWRQSNVKFAFDFLIEFDRFVSFIQLLLSPLPFFLCFTLRLVFDWFLSILFLIFAWIAKFLSKFDLYHTINLDLDFFWNFSKSFYYGPRDNRNTKKKIDKRSKVNCWILIAKIDF